MSGQDLQKGNAKFVFQRGCLKRNQICHIEFIEMFTDLIPTDCYISTSSI
jgi:hypothetical protein